MLLGRKWIGLLLGASMLSVPMAATAQDFGLTWFNNSIDITNAYVAQSAMASVSGATRLTSPPPESIAEAIITYRSDPAISAAVKEAFREQLTDANPQRAGDIDRALQQDWLAGYRSDIARPNGLDADNLADANTAYLIASWALVNNVETLSSHAIAVVRNQMRAAVSNSRDVIGMTDGEKQEAAETLIYNTVLVMANRIEIAKTRDSALHQQAAAHYDAAFKGLGIDLTALELTENGFVRR